MPLIQVPTETPKKSTVVPVAVETLYPSDAFQFNLYVSHERNKPPRLYCKRGYPLTRNNIDRLLHQGIRTVCISTSDADGYCDHLRENVLTDESLPPVQRYVVLREATRSVFTETMRGGCSDSAVRVTDELSQEMVETICTNKLLLFDLFDVMAHDYSTFTHATNVCTYCLLFAAELGIRDQRELIAIGQGALLHDIGKRYIPLDLLRKPGRLTVEEKEVVKQHVSRGFRDLCHREDVQWGQLMMIYQHHERCDGRGYPTGLVRTEIHEWGRLCAIADVFDALTRPRPYRRPSVSRDVLKYLDRQAGHGFDEEMVQCWIAIITRSQ